MRPSIDDDYDPPPRGLVLYGLRPSAASHRQRHARALYVSVVVAIGLALIWPLYPLLSGRLPVLLGLPPSLSWAIAGVLVVFAATAALYRVDNGAPSAQDPEGGEAEPREEFPGGARP